MARGCDDFDNFDRLSFKDSTFNLADAGTRGIGGAIFSGFAEDEANYHHKPGGWLKERKEKRELEKAKKRREVSIEAIARSDK